MFKLSKDFRDGMNISEALDRNNNRYSLDIKLGDSIKEAWINVGSSLMKAMAVYGKQEQQTKVD